jgi:transposase
MAGGQILLPGTSPKVFPMNPPPKSSYPSDLADAQWAKFARLIPPERERGRRRAVSLRAVANAINYRWVTGCPWRMLPHDFPPWNTVYAYYQAWLRAGLIRPLRDIVLEARPRTSRRYDPPWPAATDRSNHGATGFSRPESPLSGSADSSPARDHGRAIR